MVNTHEHWDHHFGNATTNLVYDHLRRITIKAVRARGRSVGALKRTYHDVSPGKPLALVVERASGSSFAEFLTARIFRPAAPTNGLC